MNDQPTARWNDKISRSFVITASRESEMYTDFSSSISFLKVYSDRVDMAFRESIHEAAEKVNRKYGGVDIIVSNAGVLNGGYFMELDDAKLDRIVDINFKAHFWVSGYYCSYIECV